MELGHSPVTVVSTVRDLQYIDYFAHDPHDLPVTIIAIPTKIIEINTPPPSPIGIHWDFLE